MQSLPTWIENFILKIAPDELQEGILGDLEEEYFRLCEQYSPRRAARIIAWQSITFFRPGILLRNKLKSQNYNMMLKNNIKIGWRSLNRQKLYSFINATGLSIAIAFSALIFLFIQDELSFDQWHSKKERIFRLHAENDVSGLGNSHAYMQVGLGPALLEDSPAITHFTNFDDGGSAIVEVNNEFYTEDLIFLHSDFFTMFDFPIVYGDRNNLLSDKNKVVITRELSEKYFKSKNPVGQTINISFFGDEGQYEIEGVIEDAPANTSLAYSGVLLHAEASSWYESNKKQWRSWNTPTFVMMNKAGQEEALKTALQETFEKFLLPIYEKQAENGDEEVSTSLPWGFMNITEVHLSPRVNWTNVSDPKYSLILSGIALLIIIIACINYITLSVTSSSGKQLQVGIRKAVGGRQMQLVGQFMTESLLLSIIAMILGVGLIFLMLPGFNEFTGKEISIENANWFFFPVILFFSIVIGLLAGAYPSFYLSGLNPVKMLKGRKSTRIKASWSAYLVVFQFVISAFLIVSSVIMYKQMVFISEKDLGYDDGQVVVVPMNMGWSEENTNTLNQLKTELLSSTLIESVSGTSTSLARGWSRNGYEVDGEEHQSYIYRVDPDYIKTMGIELVAGRDFDPARESDVERAIIVNEALVKDMGWENPLEERLPWRDSIGHKVIGVAKDYHFRSLEHEIEPMLLGIGGNTGHITTMLVKVNGQKIPDALELIDDTWSKLVPDKPFDYNFLDDDVERQYRSYSKWTKIMGVSTIFAILIACLGLFGLAGLTALNKTKEIGIRKALGASISDIILMMNRPVLLLSIIGFIIAAPLSWYIMTEYWLIDFQFAITIDIWIFAFSFLAALILSMVTVSYHSMKAVKINPADTLKYE